MYQSSKAASRSSHCQVQKVNDLSLCYGFAAKGEARLSRRREREKGFAIWKPLSKRRRDWRSGERVRCASQSTVQRERTVQQRRERLIHETPENRQTRLLRMRQRTVSETSEEREARLQQLSLNRQRRLVSGRERETRLQQLSLNQQRRVASETPEDTQRRHKQDRENHRRQREVDLAFPLFR